MKNCILFTSNWRGMGMRSAGILIVNITFLTNSNSPQDHTPDMVEVLQKIRININELLPVIRRD